MKAMVLTVSACVAATSLTALLLGGWFVLAAGVPGGDGCDAGTVAPGPVPPELVPLFEQAAATYGLGPDGPAVLAGLTKVESDFGRNMGPSTAGAIGWTQFMPETWARFGTDGDGDGRADPLDAADAIVSAARYLKYLGAPADWQRALLGYNHAEWYVQRVLDEARALKGAGTATNVEASSLACLRAPELMGEGGRIFGGGRIVPIPGQAGELLDERLIPDVLVLERRFHFTVTDGYAPTGHRADGEHPLGLAIDVVPGPGGTWDDIDALARWAEPEQDHPRPPFGWVGYDGDAGHGRGNHLHLSWEHGPAPSGQPPAPWVRVLVGAT
jgi:hypothetical protein